MKILLTLFVLFFSSLVIAKNLPVELFGFKLFDDKFEYIEDNVEPSAVGVASVDLDKYLLSVTYAMKKGFTLCEFETNGHRSIKLVKGKTKIEFNRMNSKGSSYQMMLKVLADSAIEKTFIGETIKDIDEVKVKKVNFFDELYKKNIRKKIWLLIYRICMTN